METKTKNWHALETDEVIRKLQTDSEKGLSENKAASRLQAWGKNVLPEKKKDGPFVILLRQFTSPLVYILLIAAGLTWFLGEYIDMTVILVVVVINASIGFFQEYRANQIFEKLKEIVKVTALVIRDGKIHKIDSSSLVPGDVIVLKGGQKVPADARLMSTVGIKVNEAILTGESEPVSKKIQKAEEDAQVTEQNNMLFMGTVVEQGEARAVVVGTGAKTEIGKITLLTQKTDAELTPLQLRVKKLGKFLSQLIMAITISILVAGLLLGYTFVEMVTTSIAIAVAAIPEGLPAAISVILAVSSQRILNRKGLVRRLVAAETLGSTSVICTDKTGTLTHGKMKVDKVFTSDEEQNRLVMALANEAVVEEEDGKLTVEGESTDRAKLENFIQAGGDIEKMLTELPRTALLPFDPGRKFIASFHQADDQTKVFVSGAPEKVIELSRLNKKQEAKLVKLYEGLARKGFRLIANATKELEKTGETEEDKLVSLVNQLDYVGLTAIRDPIREDVYKTLRVTREAGINVLMITGDHLLTASSIGRELGFAQKDNSIITGEELEKMSDQELEKRIGELDIIARATPKHKMRIIDAWQKLGAVVAMTGDGVNDAPALKAADIGVAVGSGTDVTKEASDLVLLNDGFSTITHAVREGRISFDNIKKVTILLMSNSFTEIILILSSLVFLVPFPITAVQILWANLVEDALPVFALAFEPGEPDVMQRKPIPQNAQIIDREAKAVIFAVGILTDIILVSIYLFLLNHPLWDLTETRTFIFTAVGTDTLVYIFAFKSLKRPIWKTNLLNNKILLGAAAIGFTAVLAAVYLPILNKFLNTTPLHLSAILIIIALSILKLSLVEIVKWWYRTHDKSPFTKG